MAEREDDDMAVTLQRRRFTLDEYHRMGEAGILGEDDRVELIEGEIVVMSPIGSRHAGTVARASHFFTTRLGDRATVWPQNPVILRALVSEPQPDIVLLAPRADFYTGALPEPSDVLLLVEVADSSLLYDRRTKAPLYARAGVGEMWLLNLEAGQVEVFRRPTARRYADVRSIGRDARLAPLAFPDLVVTLADLIG